MIVMRDFESSKLIYATESNNAKLVEKRVMQPTTIITSGNFHVGVSPVKSRTRVSGIRPIKKLMALDSAEERAKISGLT